MGRYYPVEDSRLVAVATAVVVGVAGTEAAAGSPAAASAAEGVVAIVVVAEAERVAGAELVGVEAEHIAVDWQRELSERLVAEQ